MTWVLNALWWIGCVLSGAIVALAILAALGQRVVVRNEPGPASLGAHALRLVLVSGLAIFFPRAVGVAV